MGVHALSAIEEKQMVDFEPWALQGWKKVFSKYGRAVYHWKALEELNNFFKRTTGQKRK